MENEKKSFISIYWYKILILIVSIVAIMSFTFANIDSKGEEVVEESLTEAVIVFGVAKGLNAAISLAQGTEISPPGLTITIGEVLDPINDLVEQFSWIMLASITSLGIQKILMNFVTADIFSYLVVVSLIIFNILLFKRFQNDEKPRNIFFKFTVLLVFLRLSIPLMSVINLQVYNNFVQPDYNIQTSKEMIDKSSQTINNIANSTPQNEEKQGLFSKITKVFDTDFYKAKVKEYQDATEETSRYILDMIIAFSFKTIIFPLIFLFLLYQLSKTLFRVKE